MRKALLSAAILTAAKAAYRNFAALPHAEQEAVLVVLAEFLPDHDAAQAAEMRLYHLREGEKQQLKLDLVMRGDAPKA